MINSEKIEKEKLHGVLSQRRQGLVSKEGMNIGWKKGHALNAQDL